jgi:hypothetical protein
MSTSADIENIIATPDNISQSNSFLTNIQNISITTWILIILILSFLGFNVFVYLAKGTQTATNIFQPIISNIISLFATTTGQVVNVSAEGAKAVVTTTANTLNTGLSDVQNITATSSLKNQLITQENTNTNFNTNVPINNSQSHTNYEYIADDTTSAIQSGYQKSGWCYIGEDRGFRTCAEVGINDTCMSGDIFPTNEVCVNPSLRV